MEDVNVNGAVGLRDLNETLFFSPAKPGKMIWGVGPTFTFPTATDDVPGSGKWSAGPAFAFLTMPGHWVLRADQQPVVVCRRLGPRGRQRDAPA